MPKAYRSALWSRVRPSACSRRHVFGSTQHRSCPSQGGGPSHQSGQTEVSQDRPCMLVDQDISGLDVAMHHAASVSVIQSAGKGCKDFQSLGNRKASVEAVLESSARQVLHDDVREALVFAEVVDPQDVRVVQSGHRLRFISETLHERGVFPCGMRRGPFIATSRPSWGSKALNTVAIPPRPISSITW